MKSTAGLPRRLGLTSSIALVVGITIGSGIFRSPAGIARAVPNPALMVGLWVAGGVISLCGALSFAELAAALPETGGYYVYLREGWGRPVAFLFGWAQLVVIRASALGGLAIAFAEYAFRTVGVDPATHDLASHALAASALAAAAAVNIVGLDLGAAVVSVSTSAKFLALAVLIVSALVVGTPTSALALTGPAQGSITAGSVGLALVGVLWAYDGFADVSYVAGEVKDPQRTLPRAIVSGTLAIIVLYVMANVAYLSVNSIDAVAKSPLVAADTMRAVFGPKGAVLVSLLVAISAFGALNGLMLASPRLFFRDGERRAVLRAPGAHSSSLSHPTRRDSPGGAARRCTGFQQKLRGLDEHVRDRDLAVLCAGGGRDLPLATAAARSSATVSNGWLPRRARSLRRRNRVVSARRAGDRAALDRSHLRADPGGPADLLRAVQRPLAHAVTEIFLPLTGFLLYGPPQRCYSCDCCRYLSDERRNEDGCSRAARAAPWVLSSLGHDRRAGHRRTRKP